MTPPRSPNGHRTPYHRPDGYDPETMEYVGPCPECGTDHGNAGGPETLGGALACIRVRAERDGHDDIVARADITRDYVTLAALNTLDRE